ncbi:hypothetical protein BBP40_010251 [Aspergillus hancockii]|nr:hypothetical protein BBP40_010251 [Aspergillus hancockii]
MERIQVQTNEAPGFPSILSQGLIVGGVVYCSGQIGLDPATGELVQGTVGARTRQAIKNLEAVLRAAGSSLENVVKVNIFLTDMDDFSAMNEAYHPLFADPKPVRTCVSVKALPFGTDVEIECSAVVQENPKL